LNQLYKLRLINQENALYFILNDSAWCLDRTGRLIWKRDLPKMVSSFSPQNSRPNISGGVISLPTKPINAVFTKDIILIAEPDGEEILLLGSRNYGGYLRGVDANTGATLWRINAPIDNETQLTIIKDLVFVDGSYAGFPRTIIAIEPRTGKIVWRTPSTTNEEFLAVASNGGDTLYVQSSKALYAYKTPR
jgi:outer membrane protein assembly factor BamB